MSARGQQTWGVLRRFLLLMCARTCVLPCTPGRSVDTLSVKELYALKNETHNRALNARMLASLFEKPQTLGVTVASVTHSPLVTQYVMSPVVARSMMKDPEQRDLIIQSKLKGNTQPLTETDAHHEKRRQIGNVFRRCAHSALGESRGPDQWARETHGAECVGGVCGMRSAAMLHGVNPDKLAANMVAGKMQAGDMSDIGARPPACVLCGVAGS